MNDSGHLGVLRRANARLSSFFTRFSGGVALDAQEELRTLLQVEHTLRSIEVLLQQGLQESAGPETRDELVTYRANLLRLQRELCVGQDSAMAHRARLSARHNHLQAARAWLASSRTTQ